MKIVLVPKLTNPMTCRFFEPRYAFDLGVLTVGTYVKDMAEVSIKSIFGHVGQKFLNPSDILRISGESYLRDFTCYILEEKPDIIGISTMDSSLVNTVAAARAIKERNNDVKIILGGPGVFFNYPEILENFPFIDFCIRGEGETAFAKFIEYMAGKIEINSIPGLAFRQNENIRVNQLAEPIDVDTLPLLSYELYDSHPETLKSISCEPGRGCPFKCSFCTTTAFWNNKFRIKNPARLAKEVDHYCRVYSDIHHFDFHSHDNFLKNKKYLSQLGDEFEKRNLAITWNCSSRIDLLDDEFIALLLKSGCNYIDCGIESGSARIRQLIKKNIDIEKTLTNTKKLLSKNIGVATNFMFGFPTETLAEMEETFELACRCTSLNADIVFCFLSPLKGTEIYDRFSDHLVTKTDDRLHDFNDTSVNFLFGSEDIRRENNYFAHQIKMFRNAEPYDRIVDKIRSVDSVYLFSHYSDILLMFKEALNIEIYKLKSALREFPYAEDLFDFLSEHFKKNNLDSQSFVHFIYEILQLQHKTNQNPKSQVEEITMFLCADNQIDQQSISEFRKERNFINQCIRQFFNRNLGINLHQIFKKINDIDLSAAYWVRPRFELFLKFKDSTQADVGVLAGIRFNRRGEGQILYYQINMNAEETKLLNAVAKVITNEFRAHSKAKIPERISS